MDSLTKVFDQAFDHFLFPIQVQRSLSGERYLVSIHNAEGTLDGFTGESLQEALQKALLNGEEWRDLEGTLVEAAQKCTT